MSDSFDEAEFRPALDAWLAEHAPAYEDPPSARISAYVAAPGDEEQERVERARAWEAHKLAAGYNGLMVPPELGGAGLGLIAEVLFAEAEAQYRLPLDVFSQTRGMVLPTLLAWGTPEQKQAHIPAILRGEELWCQLFSEPDAGSDLAGLRCRAERDPDPETGGWRITGQKTWTSNAFAADWGYLLARSDPTAPRHRGITAFTVPMRSRGVSVRRIVQMSGGSAFNDVFFDALALGDEALIGKPGDGWSVAMTTLMNERLVINSGFIPFADLVDLAARRDALGDPAVEQLLGQIHCLRTVMDLLRGRMLDALRSQREPGPEGAVVKLLMGQASVLTVDAIAQVLGEDTALLDPWTEFVLSTPGLRIGGGTDEILKNLVAERVLGMPRDPRPA